MCVIDFIGVYLQLNAVGVHMVAFLIDVKVRGWCEGVLNPIHVGVQHFLHTVTTGKSGMDTKEEAKGEVKFISNMLSPSS